MRVQKKMKELIEYIATSVVANPDEVKVTETIESDDRIVISLEVHPEDKGRVPALLLQIPAVLPDRRIRILLSRHDEKYRGPGLHGQALLL